MGRGVGVGGDMDGAQTVGADMPSSTDSEPPAKIHPLEAQSIAHEQWATLVEHSATDPSVVRSPQPIADRARWILFTFSRRSPRLDDTVLASGPAITAVASGIDVQPPWANGAKILVEGVGPEHFDEVLNPSHLVVYEADEPAVFEALQQLPWNLRKLKPSVGRAVVPSDLSLLDVSSGEEWDTPAVEVLEVRVKYGLIDVGPQADREDARTVRTV